MEAKIEELTQEMSYRAEYLKKEQAEIEHVREEVKGNKSYLQEQRARHLEKKNDYERERRENKKLQGQIDQLSTRIHLFDEQIEK